MPDSRLETYWPYITASPNPQIPRLLTGSQWRLQRWGSSHQRCGQKSLRMWYLGLGHSWFSPCVKTIIYPTTPDSHCLALLYASFMLSFEPHGLCLLWSSWEACSGLHERPAQRLNSLHWMAWQTEDQTAVISSRRQGWICARASIWFVLFFFQLKCSCFTMLC